VEDMFYILAQGQIMPWPVKEKVEIVDCVYYNPENHDELDRRHGRDIESENENEESSTEKVIIKAKGNHGMYCLTCEGQGDSIVCYPCPIK